MILQALCSYYQRAKTMPGAADIAEPGYAVCGVGGEIVLDGEGNIVTVSPLYTEAGKKKQPLRMVVPMPPKRSGQRPEAAFLYENVSFLFGVYDKPDGAAYRFDASRALHEKILGDCDDEGALALLRFFRKRTMGSVEYDGVDTSLLKDARLFVVFRLLGDNVFLHERPEIRKAWERYNEKLDADRPVAQCLVTGERLSIAVIHGNVSGFGADKPTLVGFNQEAFCSFGKIGRQGENAPVSQRAAFEYVTALNMLCTDRRHSVLLGGDKVLFWAERDAPAEEEVVRAAMMGLTISDEQLDVVQRERIRGILNALKYGGNPSDFELDKNVRFYLLGVGANKTRLVIRFFYESSFGELLDNLQKHYRDIAVDGMKYEFPSPNSILLETAVQRKRENIPPILEGALMNSILRGTPYPQSLYQAILLRVRAEKSVTWLRAGVLKATINRQSNREVLKMGLDKNERDPAYLLGRLFALMERSQYLALGDVNATLTDKYLSAALATPQMVFPVLIGLNEKHLSKLFKEKAGAAINLRKEKGAILEMLQLQTDTDGKYAFPATMDANDQGKFLLGYYHETQASFTDREAARAGTDNKNENGGKEDVDQ